MTAIRTARFLGALCLGLAAGGCATAEKAATLARQDEPNRGSSLARDCAGPSIGLLKVGLVGLPLSFEVAGVCMSGGSGAGRPAAAPNAPDYHAVADAGPSEVRKLTARESSVFPQSATSGCSTAYCLASTGASYR